MKHCNRNWKKTGIIWSLILFFGLFFLAGVAVSAEALPSYTEFTKISDGGFGDPQNNYAWSVSEFKGDLYVGTGRNVPYMVSLAMKKQGAFPENMTISTLTHPAGAAPPPLVLPNQSPPSREDVITWSNDMRPEIWRYHEGSWSQVHQASTFINPLNGYTYPEGIGYRIMTTFTDTRGTDALYAGVGFGFGRILIVKSIDGVTWMPVNTSSIPSRDTRAMTTHNGKLYVGTADGLYASGSPTPYADTWEKVADFQVASLRSFNGYLYAGTGNPNGPSETDGFEVWRSTVASPSGPGDWTRVVSGGAGDAWNVLAASMQDYKGDLYVGSMNLPFATGTEGIKGFDLIRLNTGDSWDLIVGNYNPKIPTVPRGPPLSGWPSGYANPFNLYAWSIGEYNGDLYLGTFDIFSFARFIGDIPGGSDMLLAAVTSQESVDPANLPEGAGAYISGLGELDQMDPGYGNGSYIIPLLEHLGREFGGADLWTSPDGVHWVPLELNGFGDPNNYGFRTMITTHEGFIIGTANPFTGCQVWRRSSPENPPASITSLHNTTYQQDSITWNWTDPGSANFDHVMVYLNGRFRENLPKGVQTYNASLLTPDTEYTIATRTVGTTGLVNQTWVCSTARTAPVIVITPVANFTATPDHGFVPLTVTFTDTSVTTGISNWNWNFGDGVSSALQNPPPNLYSSVQNYTVNLTVTDIRGTNTTTKTIVATNRPVSNFTATPTTGNMPLLVNFTDLSTYATGWYWDFGDGKNSTENNPGHIYTAPGTYSVSLIAENAGGSGIPLEKTGYITVAPVASFNAAQTQGYVPLTVQFTDTSMGAPTSWAWDFGDYSSSSLQNPSHTYAAQGVYTVRLEVMKAGVTNTSERNNLINATQPKPVAGFDGYPYNGTAKETVFHFIDRSTNNPTSWHWNFGDGTTSDIQNPTHIYDRSGNWYVSLTASNIGGSNTAYGAGPIVVKNPPPVASFTGTPTLGSVPLKVQFTDTSSNIPTNWIWIFGDGQFDLINRNPVHTYNKAGSYNVTLTVWDETSGLPSNSTTRRAYITATNTPLAGFTANPVAGAAPLVVRFTDQSQGRPFRFYWTFGDGAFSSAKDPTHSYLRPGSYTVTETVQNIAGSNTVVKQNLINVTTLPQAGFVVNATSGIEPTTVQFTDTSTGIPGPNSWSWDFGDGKTSAVKNPVNTYLSAGVYSVRLTVSNGVNSSTVTKPNLITISTRTGAEFRADPAEGDVPLMIQFTDLSTGNPIRYAWNFDDGRFATSSERNPVYTYTKPGSYNVTLTITTSDRVTSSVTHQVVLTGIPVASLKANPTTGSNPLTVQFTDTSSNNPTEWVWSFGDGAFGSAKNPVHTYNSAGKFTVTLFVRNEYGDDIQPYSDLINVKQFP